MDYPRYFRNGQSYKLNSEEIKRAIELRNEGWTLKKVAEELNVSIPTIAYHTNLNEKRRVREYALKREALVETLDERRQRHRKADREKWKRMPVAMRLYTSPNARFRKISNELFMKLAVEEKEAKI